MTTFDSIPPHLLVAGFLFGAVAVVTLLASKRSLFFLIAVMLLLASTGTYEEYAGKIARTFIHPIPSQRSPIFAALGGMIYFWILANWRHINFTAIPAQMVILIIMGFYGSLIRFFHEGHVPGALSIVFTAVTLVPLGLALPAALRSREQMVLMLRLVIVAGAIYLVGCAFQFVINRGVMLRPPQARFCGLSGNPQSVAITFSVMSIISLWLLLFDPARRFRIFWGAFLGAALIILIWTGSRTGAGMTAVGMSFAFYRRFGRFVLLAPVGLLVAYLGYNFLAGQGVEFVADRLVSTENTRGEAWRLQLHLFSSSPIIGVGVGDTKSENSYLYALAAFGVGMGLLVLLLILVSAVVCLKLFVNRARLPAEYRPLCDLTLAFNALYFAGGVFEGYMLARVGSNLIYMAIFSAMAAALLRMARESTVAATDYLPAGDDANAPWGGYPYDAPAGGYGDDPQADRGAFVPA